MFKQLFNDRHVPGWVSLSDTKLFKWKNPLTYFPVICWFNSYKNVVGLGQVYFLFLRRKPIQPTIKPETVTNYLMWLVDLYFVQYSDGKNMQINTLCLYKSSHKLGLLSYRNTWVQKRLEEWMISFNDILWLGEWTLLFQWRFLLLA